MRQFVLLEVFLGELTRNPQLVEIVIGNPARGRRNRDAVLNSQICIEIPQLSAFGTGGHNWTILLSTAERNSAHTGWRPVPLA